ncbi:MAG: hypothetical protein M3548_21580 [Actinomycetota bacterium]|nr:hypothetical protein [Actinomycetota bacterium]
MTGDKDPFSRMMNRAVLSLTILPLSLVALTAVVAFLMPYMETIGAILVVVGVVLLLCILGRLLFRIVQWWRSRW